MCQRWFLFGWLFIFFNFFPTPLSFYFRHGDISVNVLLKATYNCMCTLKCDLETTDHLVQGRKQTIDSCRTCWSFSLHLESFRFLFTMCQNTRIISMHSGPVENHFFAFNYVLKIENGYPLPSFPFSSSSLLSVLSSAGNNKQVNHLANWSREIFLKSIKLVVDYSYKY